MIEITTKNLMPRVLGDWISCTRNYIASGYYSRVGKWTLIPLWETIEREDTCDSGIIMFFSAVGRFVMQLSRRLMWRYRKVATGFLSRYIVTWPLGFRIRQQQGRWWRPRSQLLRSETNFKNESWETSIDGKRKESCPREESRTDRPDWFKPSLAVALMPFR